MAKFIVDVYFEVNEDSWTEVKYKGNSPRKAIEEWAKLERKYPTMVSINVCRRAEAMELIEYAYNNMEWVKEVCSTVGFPYVWEHVENGIERGYSNECSSFHEYQLWDGEYAPDQVYPFCLG